MTVKELSEYEHQKFLVSWLKKNKIHYQSSGNGFVLNSKNKMAYVAKLKASGLSVGYPDLDVFIGNGITLHVEMKIKGGIVSEKQKEWIEWFNTNGYKARVCFGLKEAKDWIKEECLQINKILVE